VTGPAPEKEDAKTETSKSDKPKTPAKTAMTAAKKPADKNLVAKKPAKKPSEPKEDEKTEPVTAIQASYTISGSESTPRVSSGSSSASTRSQVTRRRSWRRR
jgi:hypothetical protein